MGEPVLFKGDNVVELGVTPAEVVLGDCAEVLAGYAGRADLIVTSPPYDGIRTFGGHAWDFERVRLPIAEALAPGGVLVWVVNDEVIEGSESGTSFRQALAFLDAGLRLHDTMIYETTGIVQAMAPNRYYQSFHYMFVFSRGKPRTANMLEDRPNTHSGITAKRNAPGRNVDGSMKSYGNTFRPLAFGKRTNIWRINAGGLPSTNGHPDPLRHEHSAIFPFELARDHILSWTNPGDLVIDPFAGSGTTLLAARHLRRPSVGIEIHQPYVELINRRLGYIPAPWF